MLAKPGDEVTEGQDLLVLHTDEPERFERALAALEDGVVVSGPGTAYDPVPLVIDRVAGS
jgi:thymidine phosphorylase